MKKEDKVIKNLNNLKQQKILELEEKRKKDNTLKEKKIKKIKELVIHTKESEEKKSKKMRNKTLFFCMILIIMSLVIAFLSVKYREFRMYISKNKEIIALGKKYEEEQKKKAAEVRDLKNLSMANINNLPDDKKKLMLNIIPSGSPLKRELYVTSPFGVRVHPISGARKEHHGIDLRVDIGDGVFSPAMGRVSFAGVKGGYGNTVVVDHMYGFQTLYGHLSKLHVHAGEIVGKGKLLAEGGNSGSSTGPHLHYEVRYNNTPIDPKNFIDWNEQQFNILFEKERSVQWEYFLTIMGRN